MALMAAFISPSFPPLNTKSTSRIHSPTTDLGSSPSMRWKSRPTAGFPPGATPVMPSSVSIHRTEPPEMSSPTTPLASPIGRSIFISYCSTRYPVIFMV